MKLPEFLTEHPYNEIVVTGHRIGLMHIVDYYNDGHSADQLHEDFPTLSLDLIQKVIAFYLDNRTEVDAYVAECHAEIERQRASHRPRPATLRLRRLMALVQHADQKYASDPEWSSLPLTEKIRRLETEHPAETA